MRKITLSNGLEITAHVGDGFDGSSGIHIAYAPEHPNYIKCRNAREFPIPKKEARKVAKLLDWYVAQEMRLRHSEGSIFITPHTAFMLDTDLDNPYQATFYSGGLKKWARGGW